MKRIIATLTLLTALVILAPSVNASLDQLKFPTPEPIIYRLAVADTAGNVWTVQLDGLSQPILAIQGLGDIDSLGIQRSEKHLLLYVLSSIGGARVCYQFNDHKIRGQFFPITDQPSPVAKSESALNKKQVVIVGGDELLYPQQMSTYKPCLLAVTGPGLSNQLWTLDQTGTINFVPRLRSGRIYWQNALPVFSYPGALTMALESSDGLWIIAEPTADHPSRLLLWQNGQDLKGSFTGYPFEQLRRITVRDGVLFGIQDNKLLWFLPDIHTGLLRWNVYAEFPFPLRDLTFEDKWTNPL